MRTCIVGAGVVLACASIACAQTRTEVAPPLAEPAAIEATVSTAMAEAHANGMAVAVIDGGKVVYVRAFGRRNDAGEPLRADTVMVAA